MSKITTHVLDTSFGKPGKGISATLYFMKKNVWKEIAKGITNNDGRISDLLPEEVIPEKGIYKMKFQTENYFNENKVKGFYPFVEITFEINSEDHFHIPLLLSPFGYTTYRGS